jgi:hypothetical protein
MQISAYDPVTGNLISSSITGLNFGNINQGGYCASPILIQPVTTSEDLFTSMILYLQNNAGYNQSQFGYLVSSNLILGVQSNIPGATGTVISDTFMLVSDATGPNGVPITNSDYIWLDVKVGLTETGSTNNINYRFIFEYN